jgi:hypothetical protein
LITKFAWAGPRHNVSLARLSFWLQKFWRVNFQITNGIN